MILRITSTGIDKGIYILNLIFGRGYDLKFAKDAFVMVLDEKITLNSTEAIQLLGRGNRSKGAARGYIWINN